MAGALPLNLVEKNTLASLGDDSQYQRKNSADLVSTHRSGSSGLLDNATKKITSSSILVA